MTPEGDALEIRPLAGREEQEWCALLMSSSEPWITLARSYEHSLRILQDETCERYLVRRDGQPAGFLILDMKGAFVGYIRTICMSPDARGQGLGSRTLAFAEERVFRDSPNVFLCVSSFNERARSLYERLGYQAIGSLKDYVVAGHDEILMRKTRGPLSGFTPPARG